MNMKELKEKKEKLETRNDKLIQFYQSTDDNIKQHSIRNVYKINACLLKIINRRIVLLEGC